MTILHTKAVRYTEAWEHETFQEEQARWERSDPEYAEICRAVRQAKGKGEEASLRADQAKADWDLRVGSKRRASDAALKARHAASRRERRSVKRGPRPRLVIHAREGHHHIHTKFAIESTDSLAPGIIPQPVRVHDEAPPNSKER